MACLPSSNNRSMVFGMRWDNLRLDEPLGTGDGEDLFAASAPSLAVPLIERGAVARTFDTPGFRGMTFYEVQAKSVVNRVPEASRMPFRWTINPYRGCQHACRYCFARNSHTYLDLDAGGGLCAWLPGSVAEIATLPWVPALGVTGARAPCARNGIIA